jgi:small-conductance mechanosensitive channel
MSKFRALLVVVLLCATTGGLAQDQDELAAASEETSGVAPGDPPGLNYEEWEELAGRAEALSESGRGSAFALGRLRRDLVTKREEFAEAQAVNAARIATVESQIAALGPPPADGEPSEDAIIASRREELTAELARLRAPAALAREAFARADGLIAEINALTRSRTAAALLSQSASPLDPRIWPEMTDAVSTRVLGLWKEVTTSVRSSARREVFATDWPLAAMFLFVGAVLLARGRHWVAAAGARVAARTARKGLRGHHATDALYLGQSVGHALVPLVGLTAVALSLGATGLFGTRAMALVNAAPVAGACLVATAWLAAQFFNPDRVNPPPFDFGPEVKGAAARHVRQIGWFLALDIIVRAFLSVGDIEPEVLAGLLLPVDLALALLLFRFGRCLASARPPAQGGPEDDLMAFRRRLLAFAGWTIVAVAAVAPVLSILGFHRAGGAVLLPSINTVGLLGILVVLQWFVTDLYALLMRREDSMREALFPVLAGLVLFVLALPVFALIWGARPGDLVEAWQRFLVGFTVGETRLSPQQFAVFGVVLGAGWLLTRLVQGTLRSTVLPRTRLDVGAQNAVVSGLGYVGIIISALLAVSVAGLDLSNLAIVAGALSVGIGFGLQNIVQNFVSGIILLIERPISEGDWIEVGGRMGYVRDISVRSTRIETFDRTDVIIPNGDLVSGQVVNWTRGNLVGRIILPVSVAFGTDVDHVMQILKDAAEAHPMVLLSPPPAVVLAGFGADVLNFEIRAIIRDVNFGTTTRSEINKQVAKRFLEEGIRTAAIPAPPPPPPKPATA